MPRYRVTTFIIQEWTAEFDAEDESDARRMAYEECESDLPNDGYVEHRVTEIRSE